MTTAQLRLLTVSLLSKSWKKLVSSKNCIRRSFEKTGLSLPIDASKDQSLIHFQGQEAGIPEGFTFRVPS